MKKVLSSLAAAVALLAIVPAVANAQAKKSAYSPQEYIDKVLKKDANYINAVAAIKAVDKNGKIVAEWNSNLPVLTASTLKTITCGMALAYLGEDYRFSTTLKYSGTVKDGTLFGDLWIVGGGDPTLGSEDGVGFPVDSIFGVWTAAMKELGIRKVQGNIVVDDSYLAREVIPSSWEWGNIGYDYGSAPSGLPFHEDVQNARIIPGKKEGEKPQVIVLYPQIPGFKYINELTTGPAKSGDWSEYNCSDLARVGKFTGSVPVDRDTIRSIISNKFGYISCGAAFRDFVVSQGITIGPDIIPVEDAAKADLTEITTTYSPELWKIVGRTLLVSDNFYAETLFKQLGKKMLGDGSYSGAKKAARRILDSLGVNRTGYTQDDGSGLSRENYVSPEFFCNFYSVMTKQPCFEKFVEAFPYPTVGTLRNVLTDKKKFNPDIAAGVHAKSGSLSCVKTYAGYVYAGPKHGLIKFAILVNNYSCPTREIQKHLEGFMYSLASAE
ncbi:MAG: D-alanyl-D-alanine carboxypeptidase/D-alanyl-D-alanine-endopeptidase [Bacteroidales bacterium]|nr:D-alanyl-D-alanine carboxypeptidase/D-alanyl-D-alanine-endopeptidase [Bacteroidales bacterium]